MSLDDRYVVSRRQFCKGAALVGLGMVVAACGAPATGDPTALTGSPPIVIDNRDVVWGQPERLYTDKDVEHPGPFIPITVNAAGFTRYDKPVEVTLDLTKVQALVSPKKPLDAGLMRLTEVDGQNPTSEHLIPHQFDLRTGDDSESATSGTLVFMMSGETPSNGERHFRLYVGAMAVSEPLSESGASIEIIDQVQHEKQESYRINTPGAWNPT
jgi:hypothetical protein